MINSGQNPEGDTSGRVVVGQLFDRVFKFVAGLTMANRLAAVLDRQQRSQILGVLHFLRHLLQEDAWWPNVYNRRIAPFGESVSRPREIEEAWHIQGTALLPEVLSFLFSFGVPLNLCVRNALVAALISAIVGPRSKKANPIGDAELSAAADFVARLSRAAVCDDVPGESMPPANGDRMSLVPIITAAATSTCIAVTGVPMTMVRPISSDVRNWVGLFYERCEAVPARIEAALQTALARMLTAEGDDLLEAIKRKALGARTLRRSCCARQNENPDTDGSPKVVPRLTLYSRPERREMEQRLGRKLAKLRIRSHHIPAIVNQCFSEATLTSDESGIFAGVVHEVLRNPSASLRLSYATLLCNVGSTPQGKALLETLARDQRLRIYTERHAMLLIAAYGYTTDDRAAFVAFLGDYWRQLTPQGRASMSSLFGDENWATLILTHAMAEIGGQLIED